MPLITWITQLLPDAQGPYTLKDIELRLYAGYSSRIDKSRVHRALQRLESEPDTAHLVKPTNLKRPFRYSAEGARRIARVATTNTEIDRDEALEAVRNFLKLERNLSAPKPPDPLPFISRKPSTVP